MNGILRFGKRGKLSPKYIRPHEILQTIGDVTYELASLLVFHVSMLRYYITNEYIIIHCKSVKLDERLSFIEEPVFIFFG